MAVLKYRDPVTGDYLPVSYGGSTATNEVTVSSTEPTDGSELWLDESATAVAEDFVNVSGDAMAGPLVVQTPTAMTHAARLLDGTPRFATVAERDAAYATLPGSLVNGIRCFVDEVDHFQTWYSNHGWSLQLARNVQRVTSTPLADGVPYIYEWETFSTVNPPYSALPADSTGILMDQLANYYVTIQTLILNATAVPLVLEISLTGDGTIWSYNSNAIPVGYIWVSEIVLLSANGARLNFSVTAKGGPLVTGNSAMNVFAVNM